MEIDKDHMEELKGLIARSDDERIGRIKTKYEIAFLLIKMGYRKGKKGAKVFLNQIAEAASVCYGYLRQCLKLVELYPNFDSIERSLNLREDRKMTWTYIHENLLRENKDKKKFKDTLTDTEVDVKDAYIAVKLIGKDARELSQLYSKLLKKDKDNVPSNQKNFVKNCIQRGMETWREELKKN